MAMTQRQQQQPQWQQQRQLQQQQQWFVLPSKPTLKKFGNIYILIIKIGMNDNKTIILFLLYSLGLFWISFLLLSLEWPLTYDTVSAAKLLRKYNWYC